MSMAHQRRVIREAFVALLAGGATAAGARVFDHPYDARTTFPALTVQDVTEQQQAIAMLAGPSRPIERMLVLEVGAEVQQTTGYARQRDDLLADVERIAASAAIAGVKAITPAGYAPAQAVNSADKPICVGRQRFEILYFTTQGDPATTT